MCQNIKLDFTGFDLTCNVMAEGASSWPSLSVFPQIAGAGEQRTEERSASSFPDQRSADVHGDLPVHARRRPMAQSLRGHQRVTCGALCRLQQVRCNIVVPSMQNNVYLTFIVTFLVRIYERVVAVPLMEISEDTSFWVGQRNSAHGLFKVFWIFATHAY